MAQIRRRAPKQLALCFRARGGKRPGAGRKRKPENAGLLPHRARPAFDPRIPVHVTMRSVHDAPFFKTERAGNVIRDELRDVSADDFRLLHFSIQDNHLHVIVEANTAVALSRGIQRLASRVARRLNLLAPRKGRVWRDRYHRRDLTSPRQFRNALVYVIFNFRKHGRGAERQRRMHCLDDWSSAIWIDAWEPREGFVEWLERHRVGPPPVATASTWIASVGWRRHGPLRPDELPASPG